MRGLWIVALALCAQGAAADMYKCQMPNGSMAFSDRPCGVGEAQRITVTPPPVQAPRGDSGADARWEESQRLRFVEVPALERKAAELMASADPAAQDLGREMAWKAHQMKEAFEEVKRTRDGRQEIERRYDRALRDIRGY
jgi:hypothetical protein